MASSLSSIGKTIGVAVIGAATSRVSMWASKKVEDITGWSIGGLMDQATPDKVANFLRTAAKSINYPLTFTAEKIKDAYIIEPYASDQISLAEYGRRSLQLDRILKVVIAPVFEELSYRGLIQTVGGMALEGMGVPPHIAQGSALLIANTLFTIAHLEEHEEFSSERFSSLFAGGLIDSIVCNQFGLITSIAEHAISNLSNEWLKL